MSSDADADTERQPTTASTNRDPTRPTRGADRNCDVPVIDDAPFEADCLLPDLDTGITLLDITDGRGVSIVQSLVLDQLLRRHGPAFWIDAEGYATTTSLARLAPSERLLDRIHVARGFTAYQHFAALQDLPAGVQRCVQDASRVAATTADATDSARASPETANEPHPPALIVAPAFDARYRDDETLTTDDARTLQARGLARLSAYARSYDAAVLVTRTDPDAFTDPIETAADHRIRCERTRMGPRFVGDEFETLVYPVDDGAYYQTTLTYWQQVLATRAEQTDVTRPQEPNILATSSTPEVGTGVTIDGSTATFTPSPLVNAWTTAAGTDGW